MIRQFLTATMILALTLSVQRAHAQCSGYSVEVFAGPNCLLPSFAHATGIADTGAMCGGWLDCAEVGHPVIWWPDGTMTELPLSAEGGIPHAPFELNSAGQVAGRMQVPGLNPLDRAFLYSDGVTINLGALPGHTEAEALAINSSGIVVGWSLNSATGPLNAFVWQNGVMSALPLPFDYGSRAFDISDSGLICGQMATKPPSQPDGYEHAFIYNLNTGETLDVGILLSDAVGSFARGVNNFAGICGFSFIPCGKHCFNRRGFIWSNGEVEDLGVLPGSIGTLPLAINDSNVIVGHCEPVGKAFVWRNGTMTALNDLISPELNLNFRLAYDINNHGQIVGEATVIGSGGDRVAVRLTPIPSPIGDSDCDSDVDDLLKVINTWGAQSPKGSNALPPADFDHDTVVEIDDLMIVIDNWTN